MSVSKGRALEKEAIPVGVEPTIYCLGGSCVSTAPRNHLPHQGGKSISDSETWGKREKGEGSSGIRTHDLSLTRRTHCQLCYRAVNLGESSR